MARDKRHEQEMKATLAQIKAKRNETPDKKTGPSWTSKYRMDVPLSRMAFEGVALFAVAFLVGRGLAALFFIVTA